MSYSWLTIPHVTQHDECDVTELEKRRKQYAGRAEAAETRLTVTAIIIKLLASALKLFPDFNASIDAETQRSIFKKYIHIGVAVDTPRGLLVPVIRDVDQKNIIEIAVELQEVAGRARDGKLNLDEMQGGTFTVTNLGGIGGTSFTPIVNWPEVAILGVSRSVVKPVSRWFVRASDHSTVVAVLRSPAHRRSQCSPLPALGLREPARSFPLDPGRVAPKTSTHYLCPCHCFL